MEKNMSYVILGNERLCCFLTKKTKKIYDAKLIFWSFGTFFVLTIFWSGAKQRFCFRESMSVLDQNGRIQALKLRKTWEIAVKKFVYSYSENSWKHVVNSIIVKDIEAEEQKRKEVKENKVDPPSHRSNLSLLAHPDHPELVLFGGEFHNGNKTTMFNDLLIFNTKRYHSYIT